MLSGKSGAVASGSFAIDRRPTKRQESRDRQGRSDCPAASAPSHKRKDARNGFIAAQCTAW
jgi:hypothetical protein